MNWQDLATLALRSLTAHRLRSFLTLLGIAVGIAAVILLTSIGEGVHRFVLAEFTQFGTNVIEIAPGKTAASGGPGGLQTTVRLLTMDDAAALERIPGVLAVTPNVWGNSEVAANGRLRRTMVQGVGPGTVEVMKMKMQSGSFLPDESFEHARPFAVLGPKLKNELFGAEPALGQRLRIGGMQFRIIGVVAPKGQFLGMDLDDTVFIPAARSLELYNREGLMRIHLTYREGLDVRTVADAVKSVLAARHGREDFTLTTQEDMLRTLSKILNILTAAVGALGGISLLVGGVGIVSSDWRPVCCRRGAQPDWIRSKPCGPSRGKRRSRRRWLLHHLPATGLRRKGLSRAVLYPWHSIHPPTPGEGSTRTADGRMTLDNGGGQMTPANGGFRLSIYKGRAKSLIEPKPLAD